MFWWLLRYIWYLCVVVWIPFAVLTDLCIMITVARGWLSACMALAVVHITMAAVAITIVSGEGFNLPPVAASRLFAHRR